MPDRKRRHPPGDDPDGQLAAIRDALAEVEVQERQVAELLQETNVNIQKAVEAANHEEERSQRRLAAELEAQLNRSSTQAIKLNERIKDLEAYMEAERQQAEKVQAAAEAVIEEAKESTQLNNEELNETNQSETSPNEASELEERKSRLSG